MNGDGAAPDGPAISHDSASSSVSAPSISAPLTPAERLQAGRERLRAKLQQARGEPPPFSPDGSAPRPKPAAAWFDPILRAARRTWQHHPLRDSAHMVGLIGGPVLRARLDPWAHAHPVRLLLVATCAGAALAWLRPWRLLPQAALGSALLSLAMPRRTIWRALMASGAVDKLFNGDLLARFGLAPTAHGAPPPAPSSAQAGTRSKGQAAAPAAPSYSRRSRAPMPRGRADS